MKSMELAARPDPTPLHFPAVKFIDVLSMQLLCLVYRNVQVEVKENLTVEKLPLRCMIFPTWGWSSTTLLTSHKDCRADETLGKFLLRGNLDTLRSDWWISWRFQ